MTPSTFISNLERFWARVDRSGDCWLWTGETNSKGYGRFDFWHHGKRTRILAHRMSLMIHGFPPGDEKVAMHGCDTPLCVKPDHLQPGTQLENIRDCIAKGRANHDGLVLGRRMNNNPNGRTK